MSCLQASRHSLFPRTLSSLYTRISLCAASHGAHHLRRSPQCPAPALLRYKTTGIAKPSPYQYPEWVNVYRAGVAKTVTVGFMRVCAAFLFGYGLVFVCPAVFMSPTTSSLWIPAIVLGAAIPMVAATIASAPIAHAIKIRLPPSARRSREEIKRWAHAVSPDTKVTIECMRLMPWPARRSMHFGDLRRKVPSWRGGIANLEYMPAFAQPGKGTWWHWVNQGLFARYFVDRLQAKDRSAAPGLWEPMWEQIPWVGSAPRAVRQRPSGPVAMAGRSGDVTRIKPMPLKRPGKSKTL